MAGAGFATSRNVVRDLAMDAGAARGAQAACAADSGLEWFLAWSREDRDGLRAFLARLEAEPPGTEGLPPDLPLDLDAGADPPWESDFQVRVLRLGAWDGPAPGAADGAGDAQLWEVRSTGRCRVRGQRGGEAFTQVRVLWFSAPRAGAPGGPPAAPGPDPEPSPELPFAAGPPGPGTEPPWHMEILAWRPDYGAWERSGR
jgi:hypothetical protein